MNRIGVSALLVVASLSHAQDAQPAAVHEASVQVSGGTIVCLGGGVCTEQPSIVSPLVSVQADGGVIPVQASARQFTSGCPVICAAFLKSAKLDVGVGDGGTP